MLSTSLECESKISHSTWPYSSFSNRWHFLNYASGAADEFLDLQLISETFPNSAEVISAQKDCRCFFLSPLRAFTQNTFLLNLFRTLAQCSYFCCFHRSFFTAVSLSVDGTLLYGGWESVPSSLSWCDITNSRFLSFDQDRHAAVTHPLDLRLRWLLNCHPGSSYLFSSIKGWEELSGNSFYLIITILSQPTAFSPRVAHGEALDNAWWNGVFLVWAL